MDGTRIQEERKKKGLSQGELAEKLGVSQKSISKYEKGDRRPSYETLVEMSSLFGVSVDYLIGKTDIPSEPQNNNFFFFFFDDDIRETFRSRLSSALLMQGLDAKAFSIKSNIPLPEISRLLDGEAAPQPEQLICISKILQVPIDYLMGQIELESIRAREMSDVFMQLNHDNQDIVMGKAKELLREQKEAESVAEDTQQEEIAPEVAAK